MKTLPSPSTVSPVKRTRSWSRQTLSAEWPGVAIARNGPTCSPSPGATGLDAELARALGVVQVRVREDDALDRAGGIPDGAGAPGSAGPGSTTQPPTTQVLVPSRVSGDGFGRDDELDAGQRFFHLFHGKRETLRAWPIGLDTRPRLDAGRSEPPRSRRCSRRRRRALRRDPDRDPRAGPAARRSALRSARNGGAGRYARRARIRGRHLERHLPRGRALHPPARARDRREPLRSGSPRCACRGERTNDHLLAQNALAVTLVESGSLADATPKALESIGRTLGWQLGTLWAGRRVGQASCASSTSGRSPA